MKHERKIVDFAILSKSLHPAYSSREISKLVFQKFSINVSHVTINHWIHAPVVSKALKRQQEKEGSMPELKLFEQLLTKGFATTTMGAYGKVLVIPSKEFENDWSDILDKEGHRVFAQSYQGRAAFLVAFERRVVPRPEPEKIDTKDKNLFWWSSDDEKRLRKRMEEVKDINPRDKIRKLLPEFPGRTFYALLMKYTKLTKPPAETAAASSEKETKLRDWLHERQKQLLKEDGNVAIRIGKYDMTVEVLAVLDERKTEN
jgi:hypothetical protein